jgi:DNA end-binding protein Ku
MPRAIWTGSISFGLVEIPVSLVTAERAQASIAFHLLDKRTMKPVGNKRVNKETGKEVPWGDIVRGYEYERGEFVVLSDEELKRANVEASKTVDIVAFVDLDEIDPFYFDKPYYLAPARKGAGKGYALLHETLKSTGKCGIARVVLRTREYVAAVMPRGDALALVLLRYADEIVEPKAAGIEGHDLKALHVREAETKLASQLVDGMTKKWDPKEYHDDYREDVLELVERKIKTGKTETIAEPRGGEKAERRGSLVDLMPLLEKSLESARGGKRGHAPRRRRKGA